VNFLKRCLTVDRQLLVRTVPLPDVVAEALAEHLRVFGTGPEGLLFVDDDGLPLLRTLRGQKQLSDSVFAGPELGADELACKPDSVHRVPCGVPAGGHPSRPAVAGRLQRPTRRHRVGHPQSPAQRAVAARLLALLQVGFTEPSRSPGTLVVSYTTVSPLPR